MGVDRMGHPYKRIEEGETVSFYNCKHVILDWGLALVATALLVSHVAAAEEQQGPKTGEKAILAALEQKTIVDFPDEPLSGVVKFLAEFHRIQIQVDVKALEDVSLGTDTPVNCQVQNVTLRSGLNLILGDLDLTWIIRDEVLVITTPEEAELYLVTRVYDVGKLVAVQEPGGKRWHDFESLVDTITHTIVPDSWEDVGGLGRLSELEYRGAAVLVIHQRPDVHLKIAALLEDLTKVADQCEDVIPTREKKKSKDAKKGPMGPGVMGGGFGGGMGGAYGGEMGGGSGQF